jgi:prolyl-tRNA editing enzyme YbaK/EbsC (Cys-tRNA(Pro) deacylase)
MQETGRFNPPEDSKRCHTNTDVPPLGHKAHLRVFIDPDLLQYDEVWAAAGTWHDVFGIEPHKLVEASEGLVTELKKG